MIDRRNWRRVLDAPQVNDYRAVEPRLIDSTGRVTVQMNREHRITWEEMTNLIYVLGKRYR